MINIEHENPIDKLFLKTKNKDSDNDSESKKIEDIRKIIEEWLSQKHIDSKTRLTKNQVIAISILKTLADRYHIRPLQLLLKNYQTFKLSEDGESSKELVEILKERMPEKEQDDNIITTVGRFLESK